MVLIPCAPNIKFNDLIDAQIYKRKSYFKIQVPIEWSSKLDKNGILHP